MVQARVLNQLIYSQDELIFKHYRDSIKGLAWVERIGPESSTYPPCLNTLTKEGERLMKLRAFQTCDLQVGRARDAKTLRDVTPLSIPQRANRNWSTFCYLSWITDVDGIMLHNLASIYGYFFCWSETLTPEIQ